MMVATPVEIPGGGVPGRGTLAKYARHGVGGLGEDESPFSGSGEGTSLTDLPAVELPFTSPDTYFGTGQYTLSGGQSIQFAGGSSDALAKALAPVVAGTMNLLTAIYTPPAYQTVTGPGGSSTTIRVPGTVTGQPSQVTAGMSTNTLMMIGIAAVAAVVLMGRR